MLKSRIRLLVTLVLALVATAVFSTLSPASVRSGPDGSVTAAGAGTAKSRPVALSGDPDSPQSPPPPINLRGGIASPAYIPVGDGYTGLVRWISLIWATWYWRTAP